jgi:hypothetical protein
MKRIIATTALALIMTGGALASSAFAAQIGTYQSQPTDIRASEFIGQTIYATEAAPGDSVAMGAEKDWDNIGEINEVILGRDGTVRAVVLGVGGFLGIGEKNVAVAVQDVKFVKNGDDTDDYFLVVNANKDSLTAAPAYVSAQDKQAAAEDATPAANDTAVNGTSTMDDTTTASTTTAADRPMLTRPEVTREGYNSVQASELTADKLEGARVYGAKDEDVGEINRIILKENGQVDRVVLDIGGFLGMGEHQIAVTMDELNIVRNADGSDFRIYIDANQATLKAQPEFKG